LLPSIVQWAMQATVITANAAADYGPWLHATCQVPLFAWPAVANYQTRLSSAIIRIARFATANTCDLPSAHFSTDT